MSTISSFFFRDVQINFDLLGELIKFNKTLFRELNKFLLGDRFDQFVEVRSITSDTF